MKDESYSKRKRTRYSGGADRSPVARDSPKKKRTRRDFTKDETDLVNLRFSDLIVQSSKTLTKQNIQEIVNDDPDLVKLVDIIGIENLITKIRTERKKHS